MCQLYRTYSEHLWKYLEIQENWFASLKEATQVPWTLHILKPFLNSDLKKTQVELRTPMQEEQLTRIEPGQKNKIQGMKG